MDVKYTSRNHTPIDCRNEQCHHMIVDERIKLTGLKSRSLLKNNGKFGKLAIKNRFYLIFCTQGNGLIHVFIVKWKCESCDMDLLHVI